MGGSCIANAGKCIIIATFNEARNHSSSDCIETVSLMANYLLKSTWPTGGGGGADSSANIIHGSGLVLLYCTCMDYCVVVHDGLHSCFATTYLPTYLPTYLLKRGRRRSRRGELAVLRGPDLGRQGKCVGCLHHILGRRPSAGIHGRLHGDHAMPCYDMICLASARLLLACNCSASAVPLPSSSQVKTYQAEIPQEDGTDKTETVDESKNLAQVSECSLRSPTAC